MSAPDRAAPRKAYYVEKVTRAVITLLVFADNAADAKRRAAIEGDAIDTEYASRGFGRVRRAPKEDRDVIQ